MAILCDHTLLCLFFYNRKGVLFLQIVGISKNITLFHQKKCTPMQRFKNTSLNNDIEKKSLLSNFKNTYFKEERIVQKD